MKNILLIIAAKSFEICKKEHKNLFPFLVLSFIAGLFLSVKLLEFFSFDLPLYTICLISSFLFILILTFIFSNKFNILSVSIISVILIFFFMGMFIYSVKAINNKVIFLQKDFTFAYLTGDVTKVINSSSSKYQTIYLKNVVIHNYHKKDQPNYIKLTSIYKNNIKAGDNITLWADLKPVYSLKPFDNSYKTYAFWNKIGCTGFVKGKIKVIKPTQKELKSLSDVEYYINNIKTYFLHKISKHLNSKVCGVAQAITLGSTLNIDKYTRNILVNSGLNPFIAISGLHIGLITAFMFLICRLLIVCLFPKIALNFNTKIIASIFTIIGLSCYLLLLQNVPSAFRAGLMSILVMLGIIFKINTLSIRNLLLAILFLLVVKPEYITTASFLLSFIATAAIIKLFEIFISKNFIKHSKDSFIIKIIKTITITFLLSLTVSIVLFPLIVYYFNKIPLYGVLANVIVTPLFSLVIMPFLYLALILPELLCLPFFKIAELSITLMLNFASFISSLDNSKIYFAGFSNTILFLYIILFLIFIICSINSIKYITLICCFIIYIYIYTRPFPDIMIDREIKLLAFFNDKNNTYIFNTLKSNHFIRNTWVKDNKKINNKNLKNCKDLLYYDEERFLINIKSFLVAYTNTQKSLENIQLPVVLSIINDNVVYKNKKYLVIDKQFLEDNGSTFIYFVKPNTIKVYSNSKVIKINVTT